MSSIILLIIAFIIGYLIIVFKASKTDVAEGFITAKDGTVNVEITYNKKDKMSLYAMALLYLFRIKWLLLTEPNFLNSLFQNLLEEILKNWPEIPDVDIKPVDKNSTLSFRVRISRIGDYYSEIVFIPFKVYAVDVVASSVILLRKIIDELDYNEKDLLKKLLSQIKDDILNLNDSSFSATRKYQREVSDILKKIESKEDIL